jgi:competence protein ComEC
LSFSAALLIAGLAVPILERTTEPYRRALWRLDAVDLDPSLEPRAAQFRLDLRAMAGAMKGRVAWLGRHPAAAEALVTAPARAAVWTANMLLFSAVLQFGLLLPMAETFHRVTYAGIGLNALAIPVMTLVLAFALPTTLLGARLPALAAWPAKVLALVMKGLFALTDFPNLPRWLSYRVPSPPEWVAWGFALSIVAAAWALGRQRRVFWGSLAASGGFANPDLTPPVSAAAPHRRRGSDSARLRRRRRGVCGASRPHDDARRRVRPQRLGSRRIRETALGPGRRNRLALLVAAWSQEARRAGPDRLE